ncbi:Uncharacterised protein [Bacteroides pyogenes]|nr:Uncharacterised protein [Bacteroides pyogenes]
MPATLRLYAYGPRPISPGVCAICPGIVCPIYTRRISIYPGVCFVRPGVCLVYPGVCALYPGVCAIRPVIYSLCLQPISLVMASALRLLSTHPAHTDAFSKAMPLSESMAFHRKESDETPRLNRQTALASAIYTHVPIASPQDFGQVLSFFGPKPFHIIFNYLSLRKKKKSGTRKQQPPPHLFNRRNGTVFRQNTGKAHRQTVPKEHDADIVKAQSPGERAKTAKPNSSRPKPNKPKLQGRTAQSPSQTSQSYKAEQLKAQAKQAKAAKPNSSKPKPNEPKLQSRAEQSPTE